MNSMSHRRLIWCGGGIRGLDQGWTRSRRQHVRDEIPVAWSAALLMQMAVDQNPGETTQLWLVVQPNRIALTGW